MRPELETELFRSLGRHLALGALAIALVGGGLALWVTTTRLSGAVIAPGLVVVDGNAKKVQHPTGGVVAELLAHEGQFIEAGTIVARLDSTVTKANLAIIVKNRNQLLARQARLEAERDGLPEVGAPEELATRLGRDGSEAALSSERLLFHQRSASRDGKKDQLRERIAQLEEQIGGHLAQQEAKAEEIELIAKELQDVRALYARGLTPVTRVNSLARAAARLRGERGQLIAAVAEARGKIAEINLQLLEVDQSLRSEVATELRDIQARQDELVEREVAALDQLSRVDIKAPISGTVHQLAIHTVGGVVTPAQDLMQIVPRDSALLVEARITPQEIDRLSIGQGATLRLTAFNRNTTPELSGTVARISPDLVIDERSGASFYRAGISIPAGELDRIRDLTVVPGMPVEAFVRTGDRTVLSYLTKPISDHASRAFREE